jgi:hypothetical protein
VGKGAPTCRGFFFFEKTGTVFQDCYHFKNEKIYLYEVSADRLHITEITRLLFSAFINSSKTLTNFHFQSARSKPIK